ncbi:MAG TPA: competence/damage-inducible protein A [Thermoanaerobaculia bacterium]|jgi:nicotinamide-nucleotide amidase|nr:competence/damage-inducible protein A [Thermoanaerobaculia bacterium]
MNSAIIAVGSEMLGPTRIDTNSLKITTALEDYGAAVIRKAVVGDRLEELAGEIGFALNQVDTLIITGGLGPTEDDMTREALARALGLELELDQSIVDRIEARFAQRGWKMPEVNKRQAQVFRGQQTLTNERGTAPGFHIETRGRHVWVFPGVPHELEWMIATYLRPWLDQQSGGQSRWRRVLKIAGITESGVEEKLKPYYAAHSSEPPCTILASPSAIEIHLLADGAEDAARELLATRERELLGLLGDRVFGYDDDTLESVVGRLLIARGETLATAESCTGGLLSSRITDISGSSAYYLGGAVCYTGAAKTMLVGVPPDLIAAHGEVSEEVAIAMARGARERFGTTYGVGITGIAGPGGGTPTKPVGTVHIAVADAEQVEHRKLFWQGPRQIVKWFSTQTALDLLRKTLLRRA